MSPTIRISSLTLAITAAASFLLAQQPSADWTQWRGPNRDGNATTFTPPAVWPDTLVQKWKVQVITITQTKVVGVDIGKGALLWERPFVHPNMGNSNTPILYGETVIVSGNLGPTVAFTAAKNGAAWTTTTVWENPGVPLRLTNLVLMGDMLFGITSRSAGQCFAIDARTGKTLWTSPPRQATTAAIARSGDYLN